MLTFQIAFRNILRQKRRSLLTGLSMTGGYMLFVLGYSLLEGSYGNAIDIFTLDNSGHIQIHKDNYLDRPKIYKTIHRKYEKYDVNSFLKDTQFDECMRLKIDSDMLIYDNHKNLLSEIDSFSYGYYLIHLHGLWISGESVWFQWYLLQAKIFRPVHLAEYSFLDDITQLDVEPDDKYKKMLKMGVPKEAVERQRLLDNGIKSAPNKGFNGPKAPPPPPPLPSRPLSEKDDIPRVTAAGLQSVQLKKNTKNPNNITRLEKDNDFFEPPSVEELQTTLSRLKKIK